MTTLFEPETQTVTREAPNHDTLTCYTNYNCRLPECVERKNAWARTRDRGLRAGTWQPRIDATPVREHVRHLMEAGLTQQRIADLAGVPRASITDFTQRRSAGRGLRHTTYPEFATKILAIDPATASASRVDATGSKRRIQALVAAGWPLLHIGRRLGTNLQRPEQILRQERVYATTHSLIADGYPRIASLSPGRNGVPKDKGRRSREMGKANRWAPPKYWATRMDVIDDPHFEPMYWLTNLEILAEDARWLIGSGMSRDAAADRLGKDPSYVDRALAAHPGAVTV